MSTFQGIKACEQTVRLKDAGWVPSTAHTDDDQRPKPHAPG